MIDSPTRIQRYIGNSSATVFAIPFVFHSYGHITVIQTVDDEDEVLTQDTDYTITGVSNPSGGSITITPAIDNTKTLTILRFVPYEQLTNYINNDSFDSEAHERQMDLLTMMVQQLADPSLVTGSFPLKFPLTEPASHTTVLPNASARRNHLIRFNPTTGELETVDSDEFVTPILSGSTTPSADTGADGDFYLNITNGYFYGPKDGTWPAPLVLVGDGMPTGVDAGDMAYFDGDDWIILAAPNAPAGNQQNILTHSGVAPSWITVDEVILSYCQAGTPTTGTFLKL